MLAAEEKKLIVEAWSEAFKVRVGHLYGSLSDKLFEAKTPEERAAILTNIGKGLANSLDAFRRLEELCQKV